MQGRWEHEGRMFGKTDHMHHPGHVKVHGSEELEFSSWIPLEHVRRGLATPGHDSAGNLVHHKP